MAKEKPVDPEKAARKAEKKAKKAAAAAATGASATATSTGNGDAPATKRSDTDGVHKSSKADKKEKKAAKVKALEAEIENIDATTKLLDQLDQEKPGTVVVKTGPAAVENGGDDTEDVEMGGTSLSVKVKTAPLLGALVPFANPLADDKVGRKVLKSVKKANKSRTLKRGVKEVVKALRKSPVSSLPTNSSSSTSSNNNPIAIVVIAADISPMDVISHIPVLCEDHHIPYIFVSSRVELGAASLTKRPTSVVMVSRDKGVKAVAAEKAKAKEGEKDKKKDGAEAATTEEDWGEVYAELVKVVVKAGKSVKI